MGEVLELYGAELNDLELIDEPPGKLRQVAFIYREDGTEEPEEKRVVLTLEYDFSLFSETRTWDPYSVAEAIVKDAETLPEVKGEL